MLVQAMVYGVSGGEVSAQDVVKFLQEAESPRDRIVVMVMAIVVAPVLVLVSCTRSNFLCAIV